MKGRKKAALSFPPSPFFFPGLGFLFGFLGEGKEKGDPLFFLWGRLNLQIAGVEAV